jgi:hypothetical protein
MPAPPFRELAFRLETHKLELTTSIAAPVFTPSASDLFEDTLVYDIT